MDKEILYSNEDEIIAHADAVLENPDYRDHVLLGEFSVLLKDYKKLYKQNRFLTKRGDRQELRMRQINDELLQTNELLKSVLTQGMLQVREDLLAQVMNLTGELVLTRNQLIGAARDEIWHNRKIEGFFQNLDRVTSSLQERIMQTRMQPLGNVLAALPRIVTEESQRLKKLIRLEIEGSEAELDKRILESLSDILARLIRNACEHGIETPSERSKRGKPETGNIKVRAFRETGHIHILIRDDGAGIDCSAVKKKALSEGLRTREELNRMSEKELMPLFMSCFSAAAGIKNAAEEQGGSVEISSDPGAGTVIHLKLPLTLSIIPCLIVEAGNNERYAIPKISVEELVCLYDEEISNRIVYAGNREVCRLRDCLLPLVRIRDILSGPRRRAEDIRSAPPERDCRSLETAASDKGIGRTFLFAAVKAGNRRFGLVIDRVAGSEEIVVNPMHPKLKTLGIYSGTTVMGDGTVALILDIQGIADYAGAEFVSDSEEMTGEKAQISESPESDVQRVLLFEVGKHEQFAVPLMLIRRVKEISSDRIEAVGTRSYITVDGIPTLILRLDRLLDVSPQPESLSMYLLIPRYAPCPFGILMSHIRNVVSVPLILNTESHKEEGLMGTAIVQGRLTLFPDIWYLLEKAKPARELSRSCPGTGNGKDTDPALLSEKPVRILLVEDSAFFRQLVSRYLESGNRTVVTAENGLKALELMDKTAFDLIVSDIEMPEMDGRTFLRQVRKQERYRHIPALALTALDSEESRARGKEAGFDAYEKKIDRERLIGCVETFLKKRSEV